MVKRDSLARALAWAGTVLVWLPIAAPAVFSLVAVGRSGRWLFDYLMPAELFAVAFVGWALLMGAALRARRRVRPIAWAMGIAAGLLVGGQALAAVSGLADGRIEPSGVWWGLVLAALAGYSLCLVALGISGILLVRDVSRSVPTAAR